MSEKLNKEFDNSSDDTKGVKCNPTIIPRDESDVFSVQIWEEAGPFTKNMGKKLFEKEYLQIPEPIKCAIKDFNGNNCPGHPKNKVEIENGDEIFFCDACYEAYKNGAYKAT